MKGKKRWSLFGSYQVLEWHQVRNTQCT
jgi:hypothetical protein